LLTTVLIGDSITLNGGLLQTDQRGFFHWCNALAGMPFTVLGNLGVTGYTSAQVLANEVSAAIALAPKFAEVMCGTNDVLTTPQVTIANLRSIYQALTAAGIYVRAYSILPRPALNASNQAGILTINRWIREYWAARQGGEYIDAFSYIINPTSATGAVQSNALLVADNVHPTSIGGYLIGQGMFAAGVMTRYSAKSILPTTVTDDYATSSLGPNVLTNPLFTGSGGTAGGVATGTVATGWTVTPNGATACTCSTPARADGFGNNQEVAVTFTANGQALNISYATNITSRFVAGNSYFACCEVNIASGSTGLNAVSLQIATDSVTTSPSCFTGVAAVANVPVPFVSGVTKLTLRTAPFTYPGGGTNCFPVVVLSAVGAGTCTVDVGRFAIYQMPLAI
jgi:lysophospholipase L1-like esterase